MKEFIDAFRHYADFKGKTTRKEFWLFVLVYLIIDLIVYLIDPTILFTIFWLATIVPSISITVRRLRDAGFSGWWVLLSIVPILGWIALLIMCLQSSKIVNNSESL